MAAAKIQTTFAADPVLVLGWGRSGREAAALLVREGLRVWVADDRGLPDDEIPPGVTALDLGRAPTLPAEIRAVVASPGVPASHPLLVQAAARGLEIVSELELAARRLDIPLLAVTGTNGKSTTVTLLGTILAAAGFKPFVGGNLGTPLSAAVGGDHDAAVVEVSSFQLEWVRDFRPRVAVLLNVAPDHLDRHGSFEAYRDTKLRLFDAQTTDDAAVAPAGDELAAKVALRSRARLTTFGIGGEGGSPGDDGREGAWADPERRRILAPGGFEVPLAASWPVAPHDFANAAAAVEAARRFGVAAEDCARALAAFEPLRHRLARVATIDGVEWWNDSKATNVAAARSALGAFTRPVVLLAGGSSKKEDFAPLAATTATIKLVVAYGAAADEIEVGLAGKLPLARATDFAAAVARAAEAAAPGDAVLLAPACASFDEFSGYAARGERFEALVRAMDEGLA